MIRTLPLALLLLSALAFGAEPTLWSLKPVAPVTVPANAGATPIDRFLLAKLAEKKLTFSKPADPRTQVRRLYFDLVGLPPPPAVIEAFAKNPTDAAYAKLVDELLASPHFGERWARHWLDLVRYGESDGFERNNPRPTAWHYRDWVIRALNDDMPYDRFAKLQIAGDVLEPDDPASAKATGLLVAGIHNTVLGSNKKANDTARQDELEDVIAGVGQTFLGVSVQCARCHDHKFDPISQTDYYRLAAALGGVTHGERAVVAKPSPERWKHELGLKLGLRELDRKIALQDEAGHKRLKIDKPALAVKPVARWSFEKDGSDSVGGLTADIKDGAKVERGRLILDGKSAVAMSLPLTADLAAKTLEVWVQLGTLDQRGGGVMTVETNTGTVFDSVVYAENQPKRWMAGSEFFRRTKPLDVPDETDATGLVHFALTYSADGKIAAYRNGKPYGGAYAAGDKPVSFKAGEARVLFGLRHTGGGNGHFCGELDEARLYDRALTAEEVAASFTAGPNADGVSTEKLLKALTDGERTDREKWLAERKQLLAKLPPPLVPEKVFAVVGKKPEATFLLKRGDVERRQAEVTAGGVAAVPGDADFKLKADGGEGERRTALAEWVARADNPLFARVIVNRLWHHHFGVGLVETPSDLGNNGGKPSHPELLDWLANELISPPLAKKDEAKPWSLKHIHKLLVTSAAYRQASTPNAEARKLDAENRLLWRKSPTRLDAESLRDAMLEVAGKLNRTAGGPGFHDVRTYGDAGTTFYEPLDRSGPEFDRRTIYRFSPRGERSAVLETFDCPDPSAATPRRQVTTTPLQALALWNNDLVLRLAKDSAERVTKTRAAADARIAEMYRLAFGRTPTDDEAKLTAALVAKHGLPALARVLFNANEFVVIE